MTYTTKVLAKIGRIVIKEHPALATDIITQWPTPLSNDLSRIPEYLKMYCIIIEADRESLKGEEKKVFVSAMLTIYADQRLFKKTVSRTLDQDFGNTSRMIQEVQFRYKKDQEFKDKVNNILTVIPYKL